MSTAAESADRCPCCGSVDLTFGYGLAFGGLGGYTLCLDCGETLTKHRTDAGVCFNGLPEIGDRMMVPGLTRCRMIRYPGHEGSPDIECASVASYELATDSTHTICVECYQTSDEDDRRCYVPLGQGS